MASVQRDSETAKSLISADPKLSDLFTLGQSLIAQEGGLTSTVASRITNTLEADLVNTPVKKKSNKKPPLASPQLIFNKYKNEYRFTRDDTPEVIEEWERCLTDALRKEKCKNDCIINGIRPSNFELPSDRDAAESQTLPDGFPPPTFGNKDAEDTALAVAKAKEYDQIPQVKLSDTATTFNKHAFQLFTGTFGCYLTQSSINKTAQAISAAESHYKKQKAGAETSTVVLKQPSQEAGSILRDIATLASQKESRAQGKKVEITMESLKRKVDLLQKWHDTDGKKL